MSIPARIGLVVHPTRDIDEPLRELRAWAERQGTGLAQIHGFSEQQRVADEGKAEDCDLLLSIGGDGTALAAIRAGVIAARPTLAVACGSLGVLTCVEAGELVSALERFAGGNWTAWPLPALEVRRDTGGAMFALNDMAIVRAGAGQLRLTAEVDGTTFARIAGDGCVVSTPIGSSAYALAAGGPLLAPDIGGYLITTLPVHGGSHPPLVVGAGSVTRLIPTPSYGGARLELDGQVAGPLDGPLTITFRSDVATVVKFRDQKPFLTALRERQIISDSPRILAEDTRGSP